MEVRGDSRRSGADPQIPPSPSFSNMARAGVVIKIRHKGACTRPISITILQKRPPHPHFVHLPILPQMGPASNDSRVPLQRCPDLEIISDTPKGCIPSHVETHIPSREAATNRPPGRGVFATRDIAAKTLIDVCPVLVLGLEENVKHIEHTSLYHYT